MSRAQRTHLLITQANVTWAVKKKKKTAPKVSRDRWDCEVSEFVYWGSNKEALRPDSLYFVQPSYYFDLTMTNHSSLLRRLNCWNCCRKSKNFPLWVQIQFYGPQTQVFNVQNISAYMALFQKSHEIMEDAEHFSGLLVALLHPYVHGNYLISCPEPKGLTYL